MEYRKEIDGLRALAVTGVVFNHLGVKWLAGGYLGVDIFFVISGYLISSILMGELKNTQRLSYSNFYIRRFRRIIPGLLLCCLLTFIPLFALLSGTGVFRTYCQSLLSVLTFTSNFFFWKNSGYFDPAAITSPLLHTWTLGVEEQFYLIAPLLLALVFKLRSRHARFAAILAITAGSFLLCKGGRNVLGGEFVFYLLPTRMWELLCGVLMAMVELDFLKPKATRRTAATVIQAVALAALAGAFCVFGPTTHIADNALVVTAATAALLFSLHAASPIKALLELAPVRLVGKISYSLYLWHWPLICLGYLLSMRAGVEFGPGPKTLVLLASLACSYGSWVIVEQPFRKRLALATVVRSAAPVYALLALAPILALTGGSASASAFRVDRHYPLVAREYDQLSREPFVPLGPAGAAPRYILIGDSHAQVASEPLARLSAQYGVSGMASFYPSTFPTATIQMDLARVTQYGYKVSALWRGYAEGSPIRDVLLVGMWDSLPQARFVRKGGWFPVSGDEAERLFIDDMSGFVDDLLRRGKEVWILEQVPMFRYDPVLASRVTNGGYTEPYSPQRQPSVAAKICARFHNEHLHLLNASRYLLNGGDIIVRDGSTFLYVDNHHLTKEGAQRITEAFRPMFEHIQSESAPAR